MKQLSADEEGLRLEEDVWVLPASAGEIAREIPLRSLGQYKIPVFEGSTNGRLIMQEESHRAPARLFRGAVFVWEGNYYRSELLHVDTEKKRSKNELNAYCIVCKVEEPDFLTQAKVGEVTRILTKLGVAPDKELQTGWGQVEVNVSVDGYYERPDWVREIEGGDNDCEKPKYCTFSERLRPPDRLYRTQGVWFELPPEIVDEVPDNVLPNAIRTVAEAILLAAPLLRFISPGDLTAHVRMPDNKNVKNGVSGKSPSASFDNPVIHINEVVLGGAGLARHLFERRAEILDLGLALLRDCPRCKLRRANTNGCPRCVHLPEGTQDRRSAIIILDAWIRYLKSPSHRTGKKKPPGTAEILRGLGYTDLESAPTGGMGQVWRAMKNEELVAVKLIREKGGATTKAFLSDALQREARRLEQLDHPHIIRLRKLHTFNGGAALEMDWADGGTLYEYVENRHSSAELYGVWKKIVAAVAYVHGQNVVHRDLKDSNILFHKGEPMVADFGIARDLKVERSKTQGMGTPGWESPEQRSTTTKVAATMDVWALGKLLVYLYTQDIDKVDADPKEVPAEIPDLLHGILTKCLALKPSKRYANAIELEKALPKSLRTTKSPR